LKNNSIDPKSMNKFVQKMLIPRLTLAGELVEGTAKVFCPVDLGNLRSSINYNVNKADLSVTIGTAVEYAPYVEFGTGEYAENGQGRKGGWFYTDDQGKSRFTFGNKPQPFLRPALYNNKQMITKILQGVM